MSRGSSKSPAQAQAQVQRFPVIVNLIPRTLIIAVYALGDVKAMKAKMEKICMQVTQTQIMVIVGVSILLVMLCVFCVRSCFHWRSKQQSPDTIPPAQVVGIEPDSFKTW